MLLESIKYTVKPHTVDAFQFKGGNTVYPDWFTLAEAMGVVSVTDSDKYGVYITVRGGVRADVGDWLIRTQEDGVETVREKKFNRLYKGE